MDIATEFFKTFGEAQKPMAASVQALGYCKTIIDSTPVSSILDSGSGLSSAIFHSKYTNVLTIDDNTFWADKTKAFISATLKKDITINPIRSVSGQKFDFIFYDYGNMEARIFHFKEALEMCNRFFYIDDMHVTYYREYIQTKFRHCRIQYLPQTIDEYGRYGAMLYV